MVLVPAFSQAPGSLPLLLWQSSTSHFFFPNPTRAVPMPQSSHHPGHLPGRASAWGRGLEEGKLSWEVEAVGVLTDLLHPAALGLLGLL